MYLRGHFVLVQTNRSGEVVSAKVSWRVQCSYTRALPWGVRISLCGIVKQNIRCLIRRAGGPATNGPTVGNRYCAVCFYSAANANNICSVAPLTVAHQLLLHAFWVAIIRGWLPEQYAALLNHSSVRIDSIGHGCSQFCSCTSRS